MSCFRFKGVFDRTKSEILVYQTDKAKATGKLASKVVPVTDAYDPKFLETIKQVSKDDYEANEVYKQFLEELELIDLAGDPFDQEKINRGQLTPVFFGSALNNFGVERFLEHFLEIAPPPAARLAKETKISPSEKQFSGFIFKIQANMDPKHRDRVSFLRVCSGTLERNMAVKHARLNKSLKLAQPLQFFGQERIVIDHAYPGDIVGLLDTTGNLRIGDTLCEGKSFEYNRVPSFSPEHFASVVLKDPLKRKQLKKGLDQLNEEGVIQLFFQKDYGDKDPILGAVGHLQFEVLTHRLLGEYGVKIQTHILPFGIARWLSGQGLKQSLIDEFDRREDSKMVYDRDQNPIVLFRSEWAFKWAKDNHTEVEFLNTPPF